MTVVLLLASREAGEFQGGHFEARLGNRSQRIALDAGDAIAFPAKHLEHRVAKTTAGLRRSMVLW